MKSNPKTVDVRRILSAAASLLPSIDKKKCKAKSSRSFWSDSIKIVATKALPNLAMFEINPSVLQIGRYRQYYIYTSQNKGVYCIAKTSPHGLYI